MFSALSLIVLAQFFAPFSNAKYLQKTDFATQAAATYYVDPTGSDTGSCTGTGTSACATLTGVFAKLPFRILHAQTINVAAGTYTDTPSLNGNELAANLTITGPALVNVTPTTGSATGTLTAVNNVAPAVMTDSTATWTVNDFIGRELTITGSSRIIASNTATTITLASPYGSAPSIGASYAIQQQGALFSVNSTVSAFTLRVTGGSTPSGAFVTAAISNINFNNANAAGNGCTIGLSNQLVTMTNNRCFGDTALKYEGPGGSVSLGVSAYHGASSGVSASGLIGTFVGGSLNFSNTLMYASAGPAFSARNVSMLGMSGTSGWTAQTNSASAQSGAFAFSGIASRTSSGSGVPVLKCLQAGPAGIIHLNNTTSSTTPPTFLTYDNMYVDGCTTGIDLSQGSGNALVTISSALTCNNNTTCINVASGSRFRVPGTWTLTGVTNDITIDAVNYTKLNLTSAVPPRLPLAATNIGSSVWQ